MSAQIADLSRLTLLLLLAANGAAQASANSDKTITREKLVAVSKIYFRDISEFPMRIDTRLIAVKNSGKVARSFFETNFWQLAIFHHAELAVYLQPNCSRAEC